MVPLNARSSAHFDFFDLPRELRDLVYDNLFESRTHTFNTREKLMDDYGKGFHFQCCITFPAYPIGASSMANLQMSAEYEDRIQHNVSSPEPVPEIIQCSRFPRKVHNTSDNPPAFLKNITSLHFRYCTKNWYDLGRTVGEIITLFSHLRDVKIDE